MGWQIEIKKERYRIWSTITDSFITKSLTKDDLIKFLFWHKFENLIDDVIKESIRFPNGWINYKTDKFLPSDDDKYKEYYALIRDRKRKYNYFFTKMKELGITIEMKDINGVNIGTNFVHSEEL